MEVKGRVACEITAGDELVITELIFMGLFNELEPEQTAALLSCFVFDETVRLLFFILFVSFVYLLTLCFR